MMTTKVTECLRIANENRAEEIHINSQQEIFLRIGKDLVPLKKPSNTQLTMKEFISEILSDEEKKKFMEANQLKGHKSLGAINFQFDFQMDMMGPTGVLSLKDEVVKEFGFPPIVNEIATKNFGLLIVAGGRNCGKSTAVKEILQNLQSKQKSISIFTDEMDADFFSPGKMIKIFHIQQLIDLGCPASADLLVIDSNDDRALSIAISAAERGHQVILTLPYLNLEMALQRCLDLIDPQNRAVAARRLSSILQLAVGVRVIKNTDEGKSGIFELMVNDSKMKKIIESQNVNLIYRAIKENSENLGMRSLNQSLFQLMLKRKIDFRSAFEASEDPEELDSLLKKVGI